MCVCVCVCVCIYAFELYNYVKQRRHYEYISATIIVLLHRNGSIREKGYGGEGRAGNGSSLYAFVRSLCNALPNPGPESEKIISSFACVAIAAASSQRELRNAR